MNAYDEIACFIANAPKSPLVEEDFKGGPTAKRKSP